MFKKTSGDQNFISALILIIVAVTIGVFYRNHMSNILFCAVNKVSETVQGMFNSIPDLNGVSG